MSNNKEQSTKNTEILSNNGNLFQRVRELHLPVGKYALFGSTPLGVRGLRNCNDVDIIVTEDVWDEYKENGWEVRLTACAGECLWQNDIEFLKSWGPGEWNIQQLIDDAELIDGLPFVKLESVLKWKKLYGREKDLKDVERIEEFLRTRTL